MAKNDYGLGARLLHYFALNFRMIAEMSFMTDQILNKSDPEPVQNRKHVFISGLARAGTTALMRLFYETGEFCSLTYRDMPFPLAPFLWKGLTGFSAKDGSLSERSHGDRILVDFDSPEALEEVFWRIFCGDQYILPDRLIPMKAEEKVIHAFRKYIASLLEINNSYRYLSKNNNNIIRLSSIYKAFPNAVIIIPYRDPAQQSLSLLNQHRRFVEMHSENKFSRNYMKWLVHHEFGSDHRYFDVDETISTKSLDSPDYWLDQWTRVYRYLLKNAKEFDMTLLFVDYEELCDNPEVVWKALSRYTSLPEDLPSGFVLSKAGSREGFNIEQDTINEAYCIHSELKYYFRNTFFNL
ncbi:MAG TPA: sulfotransferase [Desulfobacteraceae bacterium]|nr:sulfotransferase [Desulfobacteraceae bacterium]HPQ27533.1 sulfotransferase [Desulfobacteraceae bacterium]